MTNYDATFNYLVKREENLGVLEHFSNRGNCGGKFIPCSLIIPLSNERLRCQYLKSANITHQNIDVFLLE